MANQWFAFYPGDYGRDTGRLSLVDHGAYFLLLSDYYSTGGPLPLDHGELFQICKAFRPEEQAATLKVVRTFFHETPAGWINHRADRELAEQVTKSEERKAKAEKAAAARWGKNPPGPEKPAEMLQASKKDAPSIKNECPEQCLSNATTTTTTRTIKDTTTENPAPKIDGLIRDEIEKRRPFIRAKFSFTDPEIEIELEEILIKCRTRSPGPDIWLYLSKWFKNRRDEIDSREKTRQEKQAGILGGGDSRRDGSRGKTQDEPLPGPDFVDKSDQW